jgi:hypothetical protein
MPVASTEDIVRAVCSDKWDGARLSPSLFVGAGTSVSRLALASLEDHWDMFSRHVPKPPERRLEMIAEINVGKLQSLGLAQNPPLPLTVEPKPEDWNPAHAEIPQKVTRGLANKILAELTLHLPPSPG